MSNDRPPVSPFSGVQPHPSDDPDTVIQWIIEGKTKIVDWDWAARILNMSVNELRRRVTGI